MKMNGLGNLMTIDTNRRELIQLFGVTMIPFNLVGSKEIETEDRASYRLGSLLAHGIMCKIYNNNDELVDANIVKQIKFNRNRSTISIMNNGDKYSNQVSFTDENRKIDIKSYNKGFQSHINSVLNDKIPELKKWAKSLILVNDKSTLEECDEYVQDFNKRIDSCTSVEDIEDSITSSRGILVLDLRTVRSIYATP
jgi:hypothetical protein